MSKFATGFEAGRRAVRERRTMLLWLVQVFMTVDVVIHECSERHYVGAVLAPFFFLVAVPWFGWKWFKPGS